MAEQVTTVVEKTPQVNVTVKNEKVSVATKGTQGAKGDTGAKGDKGDQGAAGLSGGSFKYEQQSPSTTWNVTHNLGYAPAVTVTDYFSNTIEGDIVYNDSVSVTINFAEPLSGYAYFS